MVLGTAFGLAVSTDPAGDRSVAAVVGSGTVSSVLCALLGTAFGALCNPPVLRRSGYAIVSTLLLSVVGLAAGASPANAALRTTSSVVPSEPLPVGPLALAVIFTGVIWAVSAHVAANRADT